MYEKQITRGQPSSKAAFEYAYCLIRSSRQHVKMGVELLEGERKLHHRLIVLPAQFPMTLFAQSLTVLYLFYFTDLLQREDEGIEKRDYLYYLAMALIRLKVI